LITKKQFDQQKKIELLKLLILENRVRMPEKMKSLYQKVRYKFFYGGRGGSKSVSVAKYILYRGTREKLRVLCTREIQNSIKDSVHSLLKDLIQELNYSDYDVTDKTIRHKETGTEFIFCGLWGQDRKQTMKSYANIDICWIEEAQSVSKGSLQVLDPTIRKTGSEIIFTFNRLFPTDPVWMFQKSIENKNKILVKINYYDNIYLPDELRDQASRSKDEYDNKVNDDYLHIWEGEPVGFSEKSIIPVRLIQEASARQISDEGQEEIGVDVARYGNDRTVFFKRKGHKITDYKIYEKQGIIDTGNYLMDFVGRTNNKIHIKIDDTGVGGGLTDYMQKYGFNVTPINFGGRAKDSDKYFNTISEMWFEFRDLLPKISIPDIPELTAELSSREWTLDTQARRRVESKDDYKKRGNRSPDLADALLICFYNIDMQPVFTRGI